MKLDHFLTAHTKINSRCIKDLTVRPETIKILEDNTGNNFSDTGWSNFLDMSPQARALKPKINCWDFIKMKRSYTAKEIINKTKRQPTEWEKRFANDISDKGLVSKIYKELKKLKYKKQIIQ